MASRCQIYKCSVSTAPLYFLGGSGFAFVTAVINWSTTLLPDFLPMSSISLTLTSVAFFASSSAFWLPELCCTRVSSPPDPKQTATFIPPSRTSGTRSPSRSCSPRFPFAPRFARPLRALCGLGGLDGWVGREDWGLGTFSCWWCVSVEFGVRFGALGYLAGQSSVHLARPGDCVSWTEVLVGCGSYVKQGLDTGGVLGRLKAH